MTSKYNDYQYIVAYGLFIVIFMLTIRTRIGYVTVYYLLLLFAFVLTLINSNSLVSLLAPLQSTPPTGVATNV